MAGDPPLIVRAVRPSEYEIAGELTVEAYRTLGDAGTRSTSENCVTWADGGDTSEIFVAEVGGLVVGCVTFVDGLKALSEWTTRTRPPCGCLESQPKHGAEVGGGVDARVHRPRPPIRTEACPFGHATSMTKRAAPLPAARFPA